MMPRNVDDSPIQLSLLLIVMMFVTADNSSTGRAVVVSAAVGAPAGAAIGQVLRSVALDDW